MIENYCAKCGSKIIKKEYVGIPWYLRFFLNAKRVNPQTGEKNISTNRKCPNLRWWNIGHTNVTSCRNFY